MKTYFIAVSVFMLSAQGFCQQADKAISKEQATKTALEQVKGGTIKSSELEKEGGKEVWSFDIASEGRIREIWIDSTTGAIVQDKVESAADEKAEAAKDKAELKARNKKPAGKLTRAQAEKIALERAKGAAVKEAELEKEHGKLVWSFDLDDAGKVREIQVDARSGAIVEDKIESPKEEKAEQVEDAGKK